MARLAPNVEQNLTEYRPAKVPHCTCRALVSFFPRDGPTRPALDMSHDSALRRHAGHRNLRHAGHRNLRRAGRRNMHASAVMKHLGEHIRETASWRFMTMANARRRYGRFVTAHHRPKTSHNDCQCQLLANVGFGCYHGDARRDFESCGGRAVARAGRKNLSKMRLVKLKGLHRSIFRQIPARRSAVGGMGGKNPVENATCATERFAQVDFPTDSVAEICTGRFSVRFFASGASHWPVSRRTGPPRLAQVDFPTDFGAGRHEGVAIEPLCDSLSYHLAEHPGKRLSATARPNLTQCPPGTAAHPSKV